MNIGRLFAAASILCASTSSFAIDNAKRVCQTEKDRPCVALVLGGGGAKGGAHIGVLQELQKRGIQADLVVGTSIGAFVGALYASGKSAEDIALLFSEADWNVGYQDKLPREKISNRRKQQLDQFPIQLDLGFDGHRIKLPQGVLQGQGMKALIDHLIGTHVIFDSFDDLPIPFRAVAADIETGAQVVLGSGDLSTALQISMSLPGIVRPIERDGRLLVDGGIANNLPISVARELGADIIIAVDIGAPPMKRDELQSGLNIAMQLTSFLTNQNVEKQKALLTDQDIYIKPELSGIRVLDFDKVEQASAAGSLAAQVALNEHPTTAQISRPQHRSDSELTLQDETHFTLHHIALVNRSRLADDFVLSRMGLQEGGAYSPDDIQAGMQQLYGQGTIARIRTSLSRDDDTNTLNTYVEEKEWGPGYIDFKIALEDNLKSQSRHQIGASYRLTNLSPYGAEWYSTIEFGTEKQATTNLYWPIGNSRFYWNGGVNFSRNVFSFNRNGTSLGEVIQNEYGIYGGLGWEPINTLDVNLELFYDDGDLRLPFLLAETLQQSRVDVEDRGIRVSALYDSLDHPSFPKQGVKLSTTVARSQVALLNVSDQSYQVGIDAIGALSLNRHTLRGHIEWQSTYNDDPTSLTGTYSLGGFLHLSGNEPSFISGQHTRFASIVYTYELAENDFRILDLPLYLGASYEVGNAWNDQDDVDYGDLIQAGSLFLGWDSPVGPAYLGWGSSETGNHSAYIYMGVVF